VSENDRRARVVEDIILKLTDDKARLRQQINHLERENKRLMDIIAAPVVFGPAAQIVINCECKKNGGINI